MLTKRKRIVGAIAALALTGATTTACFPLGGGGRTVTAYFDDTAGLFVGNQVGVLGVPVGQVTDIVADGNQVKVTMDITDGDLKIPDNVGALVVARSVATDRYVELAPVFHTGDKEASDDVSIPLDRTKTPVEWDEIIAALDRFTKGLAGHDGKAGALSNLISVGARSLQGTGQLANQTLTDVAKAATALADHRGDISTSIDNLASLTQVLASNGQTIDEFSASVTAAAALFNSEKEEFGAALKSLSAALNGLAAFVRDNRKALKTSVSGLTEVTGNLLKHSSQLGETVETLPLAFDNLGRAVTVRGTVNVRIPLQDLSPLPDLTNAICSALGNNLCNALSLDPTTTINDLLKILGGGL
ncbi:ABC transporter substrate-binding protein [Nocardioides phosphati]|uniref:ABC transporter substrate-binding protein n=1 Tax=Nocardioides phosphati TaxID=1867775 RepID=A0ABQ2NCW7_9ACTN|nr:MlaD family protein [Nocardioides phosphati]GGO91212.1 ABC transporter substrate-binding protein [Nocardioides phosphati]